MRHTPERRDARSAPWRVGLTAAALLATAACGPASTDPSGSVDPAGKHNQYVLDRLLVPTSQSQVESFGLDLDGDPQQRPDNRLGSLLSTVSKLGGGSVDLQKALDEEIQKGGIVILADVQATSLQSARGVGVRVYLGDCQGTCSNHLAGGGKFVVSPDTAGDGLVVGDIAGGRFAGGPGAVTVEVSLIEGARAPVKIRLVGTRLEIEAIGADKIQDGRMGGAITQEELDSSILPAFVDLINDSITADCTLAKTAQDQCGCGQSFGGAVVSLFGLAAGSPPACSITLPKLKNDPRLAVFLTPDIDLFDCPRADAPLADCEFAPRRDGKPDSISVGAGFSGVSASFDLP
jgi:hypothetical protein